MTPEERVQPPAGHSVTPRGRSLREQGEPDPEGKRPAPERKSGEPVPEGKRGPVSSPRCRRTDGSTAGGAQEAVLVLPEAPAAGATPGRDRPLTWLLRRPRYPAHRDRYSRGGGVAEETGPCPAAIQERWPRPFPSLIGSSER